MGRMATTQGSGSQNIIGAIVLLAVAVILVGMMWDLVSSSPKVYRFFLGTRWSTEVVRPGDRLDLGDGRFRLLVGKDLAYKLLNPHESSPWCVVSYNGKPFIVVLSDKKGRRIDRLTTHTELVTLTPATGLGSIILRGLVDDTIVKLTEGWCPPSK
ncbi:MAG: hypothetical protein A3C07_00595 [Candidatus Sungbacteria bacterium RIFCSPHIGHO2_02_FULL_47_11]|uniref:Uncharacterized protein n=1 Tax=Candidatus Sungbacteria bacterium RIFCSPHIGHO2_02_FULL_47_11 TaxID=1802270 RepID=A0A1G2KKA3_9BACT|nr:MAG: hypothetical protein A3C07_00595 [Candidatus Sungbacteria bacterium RIFCSPHIGHO2_02_FULL_47_11]